MMQNLMGQLMNKIWCNFLIIIVRGIKVKNHIKVLWLSFWFICLLHKFETAPSTYYFKRKLKYYALGQSLSRTYFLASNVISSADKKVNLQNFKRKLKYHALRQSLARNYFLASSVISRADKKVNLQKQRTTMSNLRKSVGIHWPQFSQNETFKVDCYNICIAIRTSTVFINIFCNDEFHQFHICIDPCLTPLGTSCSNDEECWIIQWGLIIVFVPISAIKNHSLSDPVDSIFLSHPVDSVLSIG